MTSSGSGTARPLRLAYSPCPNDTYIFHAWVHGLVPDAPPVQEILEDIDTLNGLAQAGEVDVVKVSFHAFSYLQDRWALLHSGGALGGGVGPLVVVRAGSRFAHEGSQVDRGACSRAHALRTARVAIPGELTTAALLLRLFAPEVGETRVMPFDRIVPAVANGEVDAGAVIHEGRFTYRDHGLREFADLGAWWEAETGLPLPLGGIAVKRDLGVDVASSVDRAVRCSLELANAYPGAAKEYIRAHAQEMDPTVCERHIALYVNEFSLDYGGEGERAIRELLARARGKDAATGTAFQAGTARRGGSRAAATSGASLFWDESPERSGQAARGPV